MKNVCTFQTLQCYVAQKIKLKIRLYSIFIMCEIILHGFDWYFIHLLTHHYRQSSCRFLLDSRSHFSVKLVYLFVFVFFVKRHDGHKKRFTKLKWKSTIPTTWYNLTKYSDSCGNWNYRHNGLSANTERKQMYHLVYQQNINRNSDSLSQQRIRNECSS
jgi:hypothetical protein